MFDLFRRRRGAMVMGHFRSSVWDPLLILSQIICLQAIYYLSLGFWIFLVDLLGQFERSLEQMFDDIELNVLDNMGRVTVSAFMLNSLICSFALWYVVQRTKQCLDFTATTHLLHLIVCTAYMGRLPLTATWWIVNILCIALATVFGEFLCMRTEMKSIPLNTAPKADL